MSWTKREKALVVLVVLLTIVVTALAAWAVALKQENDSLDFRVIGLTEENCDIDRQNEILTNALHREHLIAVANDPKLLVADLHYLDRQNETHYLEVLVGPEPTGEEFYSKALKLLSSDETLRTKAVQVIEYNLDDLGLYEITPEYFDKNL